MASRGVASTETQSAKRHADVSQSSRHQRTQVPDKPYTLTKREGQVAALVRKGLSNKEIGRNLGVTEGTIKAHLRSIFTKLGVRSRYALLAVFVPSGDD